MIRVALTWFTTRSSTEHTEWTTLPQVPQVGWGIHVGLPGEPIRDVQRVLMVYDKDRLEWHAEVRLR